MHGHHVPSFVVGSILHECDLCVFLQEIGFTHMRVAEGVNTLLQLSGLVARLCKVAMPPPT